jgi:hypothetical protein
MNANELADILQQSDFLTMDFAEDAATMLRQQQAEIEILKNALKNCADLINKAQEK